MRKQNFAIYIHLILWLCVYSSLLSANSGESESYKNLVQLFLDWRQFERPPMLDGAPDYTAKTFVKRYDSFHEYRKRLDKINKNSLSVAGKIDWSIVSAEMNGFDFNHRILQPWSRDPAFYKSIWMHKSDVPAHEGPSHHALIELWSYTFPLTKSEENRLITELDIIAPLMKQAKINLTGNARELWITGIRDIRQQSVNLGSISELNGNDISKALQTTISQAISATDDLISWLEQQVPRKTGPSGIGKENYSWYQQNVHLVPLSWDDEVMILKRELSRAWTSLKLEEHRNRHLPRLKAVSSPDEYNMLAELSVEKFLRFLNDKEIMTVADYFEPALKAQIGGFIPQEKRHFFHIAMHYNPMPLYSHFYHWFELARMEQTPHSRIIRREALLYNIFDSRNEGTATAVEEMFMQAGLYDDNPRVREIVWIMIAQRAARGLGSLYAHANIMTMQEAGAIHSEWTPRGWMKTERELLIFEQHLYLRQPGYGSSYITGKYLLEETLASYSQQKEKQGKEFRLKDFFDELNAIGNIPIALSRWQMTGLKYPVLLK
ncbi:MAG: hypothetical protein JKY19_15175 [Alcanivoracaceae bacterium]|nr:hypothetical protein [Alcanivoracaceae bacterium]